MTARTQQNAFQFVETEDGSLTARIIASGVAPGASLEDSSEAMHSLRGAFSETVYIYGDAIRLANEKGFNERVLSMGLGLGYVELLASALALKAGRAVAGESFEIVPELRDYFTAWLTDEPTPADFKQAYDDICHRTAKEVGTESSLVKSTLAQAVESKKWLIRNELEASTAFTEKFGCLCFDAFSSKSTPDLWSEEFLKSFLKKTADLDCVLSTYACTGALKRALKAEGFDVKIRQGFSSKRDSTFAVRLGTLSGPVSV